MLEVLDGRPDPCRPLRPLIASKGPRPGGGCSCKAAWRKGVCQQGGGEGFGGPLRRAHCFLQEFREKWAFRASARKRIKLGGCQVPGGEVDASAHGLFDLGFYDIQ